MSSRSLALAYTLILGLPLLARDPLPVPLKLPPGMAQVLPIDKNGSPKRKAA